MSKNLIFLEVLLFILLDFIKAQQPYSCVHDQVSLPDVPVSSGNLQEIKKKRHTHNETLYEPLKIFPYMDQIDPIVSGDVVQTIDHALKTVVEYFSNTLKVQTVTHPFLIERTSCVQRWKSGSNKGKCSQVKASYEFCSLRETDYVISSRFLDGLDVYIDNMPLPELTLPKGEGVKDVNFYLFVVSQSTSWCKKDGVQAYGSYCRLDKQNRPVAGLINLCPDFFSRKFYSTSYYFNVIMHEMMHVLGFSSHLFPKFKTCTQGNVCHTPKKIVVEDKHGVQRLVLPDVLTAMQIHLNCSDEDMGGPLEKTLSKGFSSHWHPLLMYTSLMVPVILEQDFTVMDNISLAVLSSTGWYQVNFTKARPFAFGRNEGCDFGFKDKCEDSSHLCTTGVGTSGCDLLHYTIGQCEKLTPSHPCGVYRFNSSNRCKDVVSDFRGINIRSSYHERRCIMRQRVDDSKFEPSCVLIKCRQYSTIDLFINSTWVSCVPGTLVTANNITTKCLHPFAICHAPKPKKRCVYEEDMALSIRIYFTDPSFEKIIKNTDFKDFKPSTLKAIAFSLSIPVNYIVNSSLFIFKNVYLEFSICPPEDLSKDEFNMLIQNVQNFLKEESFGYIFQFHGLSNLPVSSTEYSIKPSVAVKFSDYDGFHFIIVIPVVCCIFILASIVASFVRYQFIKKRQAWRESVGKIQMSNMSRSSSMEGH